jgi:hypothetical protein
MEHRAVLNVRVGADDDGLHAAVFIHFVGTNHGIRAEKTFSLMNTLPQMMAVGSTKADS